MGPILLLIGIFIEAENFQGFIKCDWFLDGDMQNINIVPGPCALKDFFYVGCLIL